MIPVGLCFKILSNPQKAGQKKQQKKNSGEKRRQFSPLCEMKTLLMDKSVRLATETV
jgi:hypothetical protein